MWVRSRRRFLECGLALAALGVLSGCRLASRPDRPPAKVPRIGVVGGGSVEFSAPHFEALRRGLLEHGYAEGQNILVEWRTLDGRTERAPEVMAELLHLGVAAIVSGNPVSVLAARRATDTVPIIMAGAFGDPVEQSGGAVASYSRPGGNVTGLSLLTPTLVPKRLQLLKEVTPGAVRLAAVWDRTLGPFVDARARALEEAGPSVGLDVRSLFVQHPEDLAPTFEAIRQDRADAVHVTEGPMTASNPRTVVDLARRHRLPSASGQADFARLGGLLALGPNQADLYGRSASFVHKVLQGANPADLPVEQPTRFDLLVNLRTAQDLGLAIPPSVLGQATEVIQ